MWSSSEKIRRSVPPLLAAATNGAATLVFYVLIVHRYGVGSASDLFFALSLLPNVLYTVTFGQLNEILVPFLVGLSRTMMATAFWNVAGPTALACVAFGIIIFFPLVALAPLVFAGITRHFDPYLVRELLLLGLVFYVIFCVLIVKNSYLVALGKTTHMQYGMAIGNVASAVWLWQFGHAGNVLPIAWAQIAGASLSLALPVFGTGTLHYVPGHLRRHMKEVVQRVRWLVANASVAKLDPLLDGIFASLVGPGALTTFYLFQRIIGSTVTVVQNGFVQPFSKQAAEVHLHTPPALAACVGKAARAGAGLTGALIVASMAGLYGMYFAPLAALRTYAEVFREHALVFLLLVGYGVFTIVAKIYAVSLFVIRQERAFTLVTMATVPFCTALKYAGARFFGLAGLAAASSISCTGYAGILAWTFSRHRPQQFSVSDAGGGAPGWRIAAE